jgi:hypothetical protein
MLVVDLMHEFELGVWRTLFTRPLRVLLRGLWPIGGACGYVEPKVGQTLSRMGIRMLLTRESGLGWCTLVS